jgi:hypothetical protein
MHAALESLRLAAIFYFLTLALSACLDSHQGLLSYPFKIVYSGMRVSVTTLTLGRVNLVPMSRRIKRKGVRRVRDWRYEIREWIDQRAEKNGRDPMAGGWSTVSDVVPESQNVPEVANYVHPAEQTVTSYEAPPEPINERTTLESNRALFYEDDEDDLPPPFLDNPSPQVAKDPPPPAPQTPNSISGLAGLWDDEEEELPPTFEEE